MIGGLEIITTELNISLTVILTFMGFCISLPFAAKSFDLFLIVWLVINGLLTSAFRYWDDALDWTVPFKLVIVCVIVLALTLRDRTNSGGVPI